jgi:formylglycine-generating enzyme
VSGFRLDEYEVTVGRFRQFVGAWSAGYVPVGGSGKHTHLNGGNGLVNAGDDAGLAFEPGWVASDDNSVAPTDGNLTSSCDDPSYATWTSSAGSQEKLPINCVNWYEAYAFCIWDGGFLPSESEWEYADAGGNQQREYPWGAAAPGVASQYAIINCDYPSESGNCTGVSNIAPVGSSTQGVGVWHQLDLAGNVFEWNLDWSASSYVDPCVDCACLTTTPSRVMRGGYYQSPSQWIGPTFRSENPPTVRYQGLGFRCARTP